MINSYKQLRFRLTKIPTGEKGPLHEGWNKTPTPYKKFTNGHNVGLLHSLSRTCCFDIDDLESALKIPGFEEIVKGGIRYTSGKDNRVKVIYRIPKKHDVNMFLTWQLNYKGKNVGQFRCSAKDGSSVQDVLPPSKHPEGTTYKWIDKLPLTWKEIPPLPKKIIAHIKQLRLARKSNDKRYQSEHLAFYVKVYNDWFIKSSKSFHDEIMALGSYEDVGMGRYRRIGSNNKVTLVTSTDKNGTFGQNFSDTEGDNLLPLGAFDPYALLVLRKFKGDEQSARQFVTVDNKELKTLCDGLSGPKAEIAIEKKSEKVSLIRLDGIKYDENRGFPYLALDTMFPEEDLTDEGGLQWHKSKKDRKKENPFTRIVKSVLYQQEGVYNPDMAFWYSLILVDYLAGSGYESVNSSRTAPLYVFTAGDSSDGKSATIQSGEKHLLDVGGKGNISEEDHRFSVQDDDAKGMNPVFSADFNNKRVIKNVGSAQGVEDIITVGMDHGCDILFTQDEYGLRDNGTIDSAGKAMRSLLLSYRTLSRFEAVEPRALAQTGQSGKKSKSERHETYCVHFNYFTAATNETLRGVIKDSEIGMGYTQRFIGGVSRSEYFGSRNRVLGGSVSQVPVDATVKGILRNIVDNSNRILGYERCERGVTVDLDPDARLYLSGLSDLCIESRDVKMKKMVENIQPVARVRAVAENPRSPRVSLDIAKWAHSICSCGILYFEYLQGLLKDMDQHHSIETVAETIILKKMIGRKATSEDASIDRATIIRNCNFNKKGISANVYGIVWDSMIRMEVIQQVTSKTPSGQNKTTYWVDTTTDEE